MINKHWMPVHLSKLLICKRKGAGRQQHAAIWLLTMFNNNSTRDLALAPPQEYGRGRQLLPQTAIHSSGPFTLTPSPHRAHPFQHKSIIARVKQSLERCHLQVLTLLVTRITTRVESSYYFRLSNQHIVFLL